MGIEWCLVRVRDGNVPPSEDLPICRFQRDSRVLQKRQDQSVSGSRAAIVSLVQSVHRAGRRLLGPGLNGTEQVWSRAEQRWKSAAGAQIKPNAVQ